MSSKGFETGAHVVFKLSVHLVFVTKYRRKAITARVADVLVQAFRESCAVYECDLVEHGYEPDHAHLKGLSSRRVRAIRFPEVARKLWGSAFWSPSYCAVSCGGAPLATVRAYVSAQQGEPAPFGGAPSSPASAAAQGRGIRRSSTGAKNR